MPAAIDRSESQGRRRHPPPPPSVVSYRPACGGRSSAGRFTGGAVAEAMVGLPFRRRVDMEVDHADAALLEYVDALGDRCTRVGRAGHRPDADGALRLRKLGNARHRVLHAQADPGFLASRPRARATWSWCSSSLK